MSLSYLLVRPIPISIPQEEISSIFQLLGTKDETIAALTRICEQVNWSESENKLEISGDEYWIEFDVALEDELTIDFLVTDGDHYYGDKVFEVLAQICQATGWRVFDSVSGIFINVLTWKTKPNGVYQNLCYQKMLIMTTCN